MNREPQLVRTRAELATESARLLERAAKDAGAAGRRPSQALVPTMGALHAGHAALARAAREANDVVVATIFVNPLQFGEAADLQRYPRTPEADLQLLAECGVDIVFAPPMEEVYPQGMPLVRISAGPMSQLFEGAVRPGHFDGALTIVAKLLHYGAPAGTTAGHSGYSAYFGQKDAQQLALVRRMAADLNFDVDIVGVPTVRDGDGLALSSRNRFLSPQERTAALALPQILDTLSTRASAREPLELEQTRQLLAELPLVELDYLEVVDPATLAPLAENCSNTPFGGEALALVAAKVGPVRLIDNMVLRAG